MLSSSRKDLHLFLSRSSWSYQKLRVFEVVLQHFRETTIPRIQAFGNSAQSLRSFPGSLLPDLHVSNYNICPSPPIPWVHQNLYLAFQFLACLPLLELADSSITEVGSNLISYLWASLLPQILGLTNLHHLLAPHYLQHKFWFIQLFYL